LNSTIGQGLLLEHQLLFSLRLAQIRLQEDPVVGVLFELFLHGSTMMEPKNVSPSLMGGRLSSMQVARLEELSLSAEF